MPRVDIHFHLLPGLDDGPGTIEESVELADAAVRDWTSTVVATPHVRSDQVSDVSDLPARVAELQDRLDREGVELSVCCGGELGHELVGTLTQHELDTIAVGPPGARWLLLEAPFGGFEESMHAAAAELRERGFGVVIAHPERSAGVLDDGAAAVRRELAAGTVLQVNAFSLTASMASRPRRPRCASCAKGWPLWSPRTPTAVGACPPCRSPSSRSWARASARRWLAG